MNPTLPDKPATYDLHMHSYWSYDASADVEAYFAKAHELGLRGLAITEHHNIDSMDEILAVAKKYPDVHFIPAAELTVNTSMADIDLLIYRVPQKPTGLLKDVLEEYHEWQRMCGRACSAAMVKMGFPYTEEDRLTLLRSYRPERAVRLQGATHVSYPTQLRYFIGKGYVKSHEDLQGIFRESGVSFPLYPDVGRVVQAVKEAGALVVLAHPALYWGNDWGKMDRIVSECQLDGIECAHPTAAPAFTQALRDFCRKRALISTAGGDNHDNEGIHCAAKGAWTSTPDHRLAGHIGPEQWFDEFLERLSR